MRQPDNQRDRELFDEIFSDRDRAAEAITYTLRVDGQPVGTTALRTFTEGENPAVGLDGATPSPLPPAAERKEARVVLRVEGREWLDYQGRVLTIGEDDAGSGNVGGSTAGYWQGGDDAIRFGAFPSTPYADTPGAALSDMLRRFPYHGVRVPKISVPLFVRQGADAYPPIAAVGEGIEAVCSEARVAQRDSFLDVAGVFPKPSLGGIVSGQGPRSGSATRWRVGREVAAFSASLKNSARYRDVDVVRLLADGTYLRLLKDPVPVRYPPGVGPPPSGTTLYEELSDDTEEDTANAKFLGLSVAGVLSRGGEHAVTITTPFIDPRIEDYDVREVENVNRQTSVTTLWRVLIESQERDYAGGSATYSGTGVILSRTEPPRRVVVP